MKAVLLLLLLSLAGCVDQNVTNGYDRDIHRRTEGLPYQTPTNSTSQVLIAWYHMEEWEGPWWEANTSILERFPVLAQIFEIGDMLADDEFAQGHFDREGTTELCTYSRREAWNYQDENGSRYWARPAWERKDRIYVPLFGEDCAGYQ